MSPHLFLSRLSTRKKSPTTAQKPKCPSYERPAKKDFFSFFFFEDLPRGGGGGGFCPEEEEEAEEESTSLKRARRSGKGFIFRCCISFPHIHKDNGYCSFTFPTPNLTQFSPMYRIYGLFKGVRLLLLVDLWHPGVSEAARRRMRPLPPTSSSLEEVVRVAGEAVGKMRP